MNNVGEMKMFFGMTKEAWLSLTRSQRLHVMQKDIDHVKSRLQRLNSDVHIAYSDVHVA